MGREAGRYFIGLFITSAVMLTVGLLACLEPARRALRIQPTEAEEASTRRNAAQA